MNQRNNKQYNYQGITNYIDELIKMSNMLFHLYGKKITAMTELERQISVFYVYGMCNGLGLDAGLRGDSIDDLMKEILELVFLYSKEEAELFLKELVDSTEIKHHKTQYVIIHKGVEGYYCYIQKRYEKLYDEFFELVQIILE